jgi:hypothetical protein
VHRRSGDFFAFLDFLPRLGRYYDASHGANHIFLHAEFPTNRTAINPNNLELHPGHFFTSGFQISDPKNLIFPLNPSTRKIDSARLKKRQIAVDGSIQNCIPDNIALRKQLSSVKGLVVAKTHDEFLQLMEESEFSVVSACESQIPFDFYDAINALSIPIVVSDVMRFPFEGELIDYAQFVVSVPENETSGVRVLKKLKKRVPKMQRAIIEARRMLEFSSGDGSYVWATAWSLYMQQIVKGPMGKKNVVGDIFHQ